MKHEVVCKEYKIQLITIFDRIQSDVKLLYIWQVNLSNVKGCMAEKDDMEMLYRYTITNES
jgi:hypothetical protein